MLLFITGDSRDVANSAWVSTMDEQKAQERSDADVGRVLSFLIQNHHTSPFESVTLTFVSESLSDDALLEPYYNCNFSKKSIESPEVLTIDLLNFAKVTYKNSLFSSEPWAIYECKRSQLAEKMKNWSDINDTTSESVDDNFENTNMSVEVINVHDVGIDAHSRATWHIRLPLSIAVQLLRHRSTSPNASSGRYRTLVAEMMHHPKDSFHIFGAMNDDLIEYFLPAEEAINTYNNLMKKAKENRDNGIITNNEYKRVREYARFILPEGRLTEMYVTMYLDDFNNNYLLLRNSTHAQMEHIWIAQQMQKSLEEHRKNHSAINIG